MAITTSFAYQAGMWLLFIVVVVGWSTYFHVPALARQVVVLPSISVLTLQRGPYRIRAIDIRGQHRGLRLVSYALLKKRHVTDAQPWRSD